MADESAGGQAPKQHSPVTKKRYQKPAFRYERVFETLALACGKIGPNEFQCRFNPKSS
ncbi:MAG: hypothetical protein WCC22_19930 [Terriglobales bacterium]